MVIIPKSVFDKNPFDEVTCNGWDLYAGGLTASASDGPGSESMSYHYLCTTGPEEERTKAILSLSKKVLKKHKDHYSRINTTIDSWSTLCPLSIQRTAQAYPQKPQRALRKATNLVES